MDHIDFSQNPITHSKVTRTSVWRKDQTDDAGGAQGAPIIAETSASLQPSTESINEILKALNITARRCGGGGRWGGGLGTGL